LGNLLENAFKYCNQQVNIVLRQQNRRIIVRIEDDGPGVPANASEDIIKRGKRMDTQIEGQGLGLAIASDIV
ncbi:MAG TPA: histidine kinase, partial [Methylophaga sp.]|nr:histidine kinase [Methylophaga sp.]